MSILSSASAHAAESGLWTDVPESSIARTASARQIIPLAYRNVELDRGRLAALLAQTPLESAVAAIESETRLSLPLADGRFVEFRIVEAPIMEAELAAKFPDIRTYIGQGIDDRSATLRFDLTPTGFHAQIISWEGSTYIDPYQPGDLDHYIVYRKHDAQEEGERPRCLVTGEELPKDAPNFQKRNQVVKVSSGTSLRTYRVAIAATGEYTAFHGGTVAGGMAAIATTLNRVVGIYERDLSVRMTLVANNNLIVYTDPNTDPYTNANGSTMLGQNQTNLNAVIGSANYDIGHVVSTGGGGVAGLGVVCSSSKARGVTGSPSPVGDPFDVDYVAHEMGHQFGGSHTFNSTNSSCGGGNRSASSAYEVGSGLTIQAYAGICGNDNLQSNSEPYFHRRSLNQMLAFTTNAGSGASCGVATATGNDPPTVNTPAAFTIPRSTPFTLTASGSDPNGDTLTFLWEEFDLGPTNSPAGTLSDNGGPLFRNFSPVTSPARTFPRLQYILNNANVPPQTTGSFLTGELLPSTNRTMNFRVTARDNRAGGGGTNEAATAITINAASGPFAVTSPNTAVTLDAAQPQTITWDVAGTNAPPVNTATVTISLSLDGGNTFPLTLATGEANDGSATLILAGITPTTQGRIRIAADDNVYFDISDVNFSITGNGGATVTTAPLVVAEGDSGTSSQQLTLQLAGQVAGGFTVNYQTRNDTAVAGQDYVAASGSVSFDGSANASRTITLGIVGDTVPEADERFFVDLSTTAAPAVQLSPAAVSVDIINDDLSADLLVTHQRNAGTSAPGQAISYSATVLNQSSIINVPNTTFSYTLGAELSNITWTCSASGGATCAASGSGAISHNIVLPAGGSVSYTINAVILASTAPGTSVQTTAAANVIAPYSDPDTSNNTIPVQFTVSGDAMFANGFE